MEGEAPALSGYRRARKRTAEVLFSANKDEPVTHFVDIALIILIALNVLAVVLESVKDIHAAAPDAFYYFEVFSVAIFTVEYLARVWCVIDNPWDDRHTHPLRGRVRYMFRLMAIIDLLAIAPFYLSMFFVTDLRMLRALRLLRIFKLTRYSSAMTLLLMVLREEGRTIGAALFVSILMVFVASTLVFIAEHPAQPEVFSSIPAAMYWAVITMTTVGFGDIVPVTPWGKVIGAFIGVIGLGMVALPAGILASGFNNALHRRRSMLEERVHDALADGVISDDEQADLDKLVQRLNLNDVDARAIQFAVKHQRAHQHQGTEAMTCPHCGKALDEPPEKQNEE